jgi:hypothetical protein
VSVCFGIAFSISTSFVEIGKILGVLPFSGVIRTERFFKSMSVHFSMLASPHLNQFLLAVEDRLIFDCLCLLLAGQSRFHSV